ncbi:MAG: tetratricopeptide repeat protein [Gammaproteobacteria bacterium]|nr:tetratricopeptide repeat protein [Gammaproteobacteria bacterium]
MNTRDMKILLVALSASLLGACATTQPEAPPSRIEIQEEVGFTITEEARIGGDVRADYETALSYLQQGRHDEGIELLEQVAAAAPELSAPRIDLGIARHRAGDLEAAESSLLLALESNPEQPVAHNELGIIYRKTGRFDEARKSYEAALAIYPGFHFARRNLAILCDLYLADPECALENYEAYMKTVPSDEEASMWIADIRYRLDQ